MLIFEENVLHEKKIFVELFPLCKRPGRAHMGPYGIKLEHVPKIARSGSRAYFVAKCRSKFASFCLEKLNKLVLTKNHINVKE